MSKRTVRIYSVMFDGSAPGPAGDGTHIMRFRRESAAKAFAAEHTCYGQPTDVQTDDVPAHIADRWSIVS